MSSMVTLGAASSRSVLRRVALMRVTEADVERQDADEYVANGGRTIYFTISQWDPYTVFWYRADLVKTP